MHSMQLRSELSSNEAMAINEGVLFSFRVVAKFKVLQSRIILDIEKETAFIYMVEEISDKRNSSLRERLSHVKPEEITCLVSQSSITDEKDCATILCNIPVVWCAQFSSNVTFKLSCPQKQTIKKRTKA